MSWLTDWNIRKSHDIAAATGAGTDYQKRITAYFSGPAYKYSELEDVDNYLLGAGEQFQRHSFYGVGLYWCFYCDGTNIVYKTSSNGISWSSKTTIRASNRLYKFDILWDDPYLYYATGRPEESDLYFRRGIPNANGTITWTSAEVVAVNYSVTNTCLAKDSNGKIWVAYHKYTGANDGFYITKNDAVDGSWSTASGYPLRLAAPIDQYGRTEGCITALTNGKMYAAYGKVNAAGENPSLVYGKLFDGVSWGNEETISTDILTAAAGASITIDAKEDDVYAIYSAENVEDKITITFNKRVYGVGWGTDEHISEDFPDGPSPINLGPAMTFDPDTDELWVFYGDPSNDLIYVRKRISTGWQDQETFYDFSDIHDMDNFVVNAFRRPWDNHLVIQFDSNAGATNKIWWINYVTASGFDEFVFLNENCRADFGDIRFTDNDGETSLDYWMQEKVNSDYAIFWVKIAGDLSTEAQSIYIYYGNAEANYPVGDDQDEMDATFLFADHFYGDTLDVGKWDLDNAPTVDVSDSICTVSSVDANWRGISSDESFGPYGIAWVSRKQFSLDEYNAAGMENASNWIDDSMMFFLVLTFYRIQTTNEGSLSVNEDISDPIGTYHIYQITWKAGFCGFYTDDILRITHSTNIPNEVLKAWMESYNSSQDSDWVAIRKWVDPEPVHGIWGSEESLGSLPGLMLGCFF